MLPPLFPCYTLDYLGWQLLVQLFHFYNFPSFHPSLPYFPHGVYNYFAVSCASCLSSTLPDPILVPVPVILVPFPISATVLASVPVPVPVPIRCLSTGLDHLPHPRPRPVPVPALPNPILHSFVHLHPRSRSYSVPVLMTVHVPVPTPDPVTVSVPAPDSNPALLVPRTPLPPRYDALVLTPALRTELSGARNHHPLSAEMVMRAERKGLLQKKENRCRRRATSVPSARCWDSLECVFDLYSTFRVEKGPEEPRPPSADKLWVSLHYALFIADVLRVNLPRVLYVQELAALEEPHLVALAQILLHTLGVSFKEYMFGIVTDPVDAGIFSADSPHQLLVLGISPLPLPGCSSRGHRHADLCFCLGVSPPTPPRQPGRSRRRNPFCCLQYGCRKGSLPIINTAAAWRKRPEVVSDRCRYLLAQLGVSY